MERAVRSSSRAVFGRENVEASRSPQGAAKQYGAWRDSAISTDALGLAATSGGGPPYLGDDYIRLALIQAGAAQ